MKCSPPVTTNSKVPSCAVLVGIVEEVHPIRHEPELNCVSNEPVRVIPVAVVLLILRLASPDPMPLNVPLKSPLPDPVNEPLTDPVNEPDTDPVNEPDTDPVADILPVNEPDNDPVADMLPVNEPDSVPVDDEPDGELKSITPLLKEIEAVTVLAPDPLTNLNESLLAKTSNHGLSDVPKVADSSLGIILPEISIDPLTVSEPFTECEPVKCLKLLSNSSIVRAEPLPPEPVLNVNAIFY